MVAIFWTQVQRLFSNNTILKLNLFNILLGDLEEETKMINNIVILLGKIFIFRTKEGDLLHINRFKEFVKQIFITETYIAENSGSTEQLLCRWNAVRGQDILEMLT